MKNTNPSGSSKASTANPQNIYDDDNIPEVDLPGNKNEDASVEPLPESTRPRQDGPGGN